jgi:dTDP-4-dehydrorhamnose 3,5-epimerase
LKVLSTKIDGLRFVEPRVFGDDRGFFCEVFHADRYAAVGIPRVFIQDNLASSTRGVLRGLHFQNPFPQGKLIHVLVGEIFDVAVDLRRNSPTFGQSEAFHVSADNKRQLYIPPGFAHGFQALSELALVFYKCTEVYHSEAEASLLWSDPDLKINWPLPNPNLSTKDAAGLRLRDFPAERLFS